jgi:4-diphosphocytidyl-2-C-methyl-D-erythritol kinase
VTPRVLCADAPAKVNLTLRVLGRRADGYHAIESLVARIGLCDRLEARRSDEPRCSLACDSPAVPHDATNLVLQAAERLRTFCGVSRGAHLMLTKRIPPGSGLGGGSSDAAAALRLLNELWSLHLAQRELLSLASEIGSDVPLFLHRPTAVIRGRGEIVEETRSSARGFVVLILAGVHLSSRDVYKQWDRVNAAEGTARAAPPRSAAARDDPERLEQPTTYYEELLANLHSPVASARLVNDLQRAAFELSPALRRDWERVNRLTAGAAHMTGSGSGLFVVAADRAGALDWRARIRSLLPEASVLVAPFLSTDGIGAAGH